MTLGLMETARPGRSKTASLAYWKPECPANPQKSAPQRSPSNRANKESFGLLLTQAPFVDDGPARFLVRHAPRLFRQPEGVMTILLGSCRQLMPA